MSIILNTGFSIGSKDLIYDKFVLTKEEMLNMHENTYPDHFFTLCSDDDKMYSFNINRTPNAETGKFRELTSEGISTADAVTYENDTIGSTNVEEALNTVITDLHTHNNKEVIDLLSESAEGKLQYNGITIGGEEVDLTGLFMTSPEITAMLDDIFSGTSTAIYTTIDSDGYTLVDSDGYEIIIA